MRHGESTYNVLGLLNGDPGVRVSLTGTGRAQAALAAERLAPVMFDIGVHTGFPRTIETLEIILGQRDIPIREIPQLGDVRLGIFEGSALSDYRDWRADHRLTDAPPGGESRIEIVDRYVDGFTRLLRLPFAEVLAVMHDIPIRILANALVDKDPLDGPVTRVRNAEVHVVDEAQIAHAIDQMKERVRRAYSPTL